ncbi:hypothetical protein SAMN05421803_14314 [Nocardiopsis flavescens]|uniref:Uncharacterized protein n=1 Tax=Nocardiopsis flavescens TaxID=758803 RepID=A0A1M6WF95_9ACTN|nr:hypothetical protein [Nocardiopsis flavescens]SHK92440.1 hypothetical protein SAMN05421803_14314 [Nocardiopsis flavescens]
MPPIRHRPRVHRWREDTSQGEAWCYQVRCECGTEFGEYYAERLAETERAEHRMAVAPPREQRCRDPKRHRMQSWDRCCVCADQLPLPGMEDPAALAGNPR